MKRYLIIFVTLLSCINIYSQNVTFGFNKALEFNVGYSNVHNQIRNKPYEPKHLINTDVTIHGAYLGFGYGSNDIYCRKNYPDLVQYGYAPRINTYILRGGLSLRLGNKKYGLTFTPFAGILFNSSNIECYKYIFNGKTAECDALYGLKVSFNVKKFVLGWHASNKDIGASVGIRIPM
jgi:hypothetical protein